MAPLIQDTDIISLPCHDNVFDNKTIVTPLHERTIPTPRRVSFGAMVATYEVMSRYEYTSEELEASWFDRVDMRRMKENMRAESKLLDSGLLLQGTGVSIRGLRTREGIKRKREYRMNSYSAVFHEIEFQQEEHFIDEEAIADEYFICSEPSAMEAHMIGKRDEIEAMDIHDNQKTDQRNFLQFNPPSL